MAVLDDALTVLQFGTPESRRPATPVLQSARRSVGSYLDTVGTSFGHSADRAPPPPDIAVLRDADMPTVEGERFRRSVAETAGRRRQLRGLLDADAREWPGVDG